MVSIIIPSYNHAHYIHEAINSALAQTYKNIEIVVIDDGSTDNTKEVVTSYTNTGKVRYIYQENRGLAAARNSGLRVAKGRYIKFLDSDDFLYPEQIKMQVDQIKTNDSIFSISDCIYLRPNGTTALHKYYPPDPERQLNVFIEANQAPVHSFLTPKSLIEKAGGFDETLKACEDWDLWIRILQGGAITKHLPYAGCCYRISMTSMSSDSNKMFIQKCKVIEKVNDWLLKKDNLSQRKVKWFWFSSALKTNIKLCEESIARGIYFESVLPIALRMTDRLLRTHWNLILRALHSIIGTNKYIRMRYVIKIIFKKNYKFNILNLENLWKLGEPCGKKTPHFLFFRKLMPDAGWGGTEVVLMDWFSQIDYRRSIITLAVPSGSKEIFSKHININSWPVNIVEYAFPAYGNNGKAKFLSMLKFMFHIRPHCVIFVQGWYLDFNFPEVLAAFFLTAGRVFMHENVGPDAPPAKTSRKHLGFLPGFSIWWHKITFFVYGKAYFCKKVLFVSKDIRKKFISSWGYPKHNSLVMYHGTEVSRYLPSQLIRETMRGAFRISDTDIVIIATARLAKFKCLDRLINAFDSVSRDFSNLQLLLAGTGPLEKELKDLAASKASFDRIRFLGHMDNIPDLLRMSDIYVLSSDNEGLSLALLEAMASGMICISTKCPGSPEVIENEVNGFLVEPNSLGVEKSIRKIMSFHFSQKKFITEQARKTVLERFNVRSNAKKALGVFGIPSLT